MQPNDFQRQLLADKINDVSQRIDRYKEDIKKLSRQLEVKNTNLATLEREKALLEEGVDW